MTGEQPVGWPCASLTWMLVCGCAAIWIATIQPVRADDAAVQHAELIPQDELVVQGDSGSDKLPVTYCIRVSKHQDRIKLKGSVPSEEDYKTVIGLVKASFPAVELTDRVQIKQGTSAREVKIGGLSFALKMLTYLEKGQASVDDNGLSIDGSTNTAVILPELRRLIDNNKPTGVPLRNIRISPPQKSWSASITPDGALKVTGVVPTAAGKQAIADTVHKLFPGRSFDDNTALNGTLTERWMTAALHSLQFLRLLDKGSVELTDQTIRLRGAAPSETAVSKIDALAADLPNGFALKSEVTSPVMRAGWVDLPQLETQILLPR